MSKKVLMCMGERPMFNLGLEVKTNIYSRSLLYTNEQNQEMVFVFVCWKGWEEQMKEAIHA